MIAVIFGIALLPVYLMSAMFISNLFYTKPMQIKSSFCQPITVLICVRNEEPSIYETLQQIVSQSYEGRISVLCIDNGSTDTAWCEHTMLCLLCYEIDRFLYRP